MRAIALIGSVAAFWLPAVPASASLTPTGVIGNPSTSADAVGGAGGKTYTPYGVDLAPDGSVVMASNGWRRVDVFGADGSFVRSFGRDVVPGGATTSLEVCTAVTTCKPGEIAPDTSGFNLPNGLATGADGTVFVADQDGDVHVLPPTGTEAYEFGAAGSAAGQLQTPFAIEVGPTGDVFVAELGNNRVSRWSPDGTFRRAWGKDVIPANAETGFEVCTTSCKAGVASDEDGAFQYTFGVATDAAGNVYASDGANLEVQVFSADGAFVRRIAMPPNVIPAGLEVAPNGDLFVAAGGGSEGNKIIRFRNDVVLEDVGSTGEGSQTQFIFPRDVVVSPCGGTLYVAVPGGNNFMRLQRFQIDTGEPPGGCAPAPPLDTSPGPSPAAPAPTPALLTTPASPVAPAQPVVRITPPPRLVASRVLAFPAARSCASRRSFRIRLRVPRGVTVVRATVRVNGRQVRVLRGDRLRSAVDLRGLPRGRFTVQIALRTADGRTVSGRRAYRTCTRKQRRRGARPPV